MREKTLNEQMQAVRLAAIDLGNAVIKAWRVEDFLFWLSKKVERK